MILVTGATGFVGTQLAFDLLQQGEKIRALKRPYSPIPSKLSAFNEQQIEWTEGDVLDTYSLEEAMKNVDKVYHCAAKVSLDPKTKKKLFRTNIEGTANVVNTALVSGVNKLVHVSSIAAIGNGRKGELITEKTPWEYSNSPYSISKYYSEGEVWRGIAEGLNAVIVNPSVIIGYDERGKSSGRLFDLARKGLRYYTDGGTGFVDVQDVSRCMISLMESNITGERFILNSENRSYKDFFFKASGCLGTQVPSIRLPKSILEAGWRVAACWSFFSGRPSYLSRTNARTAYTTYRYSNEKIRKAIGADFTPVERTIEETCAQLKSGNF